MKTLVLVPALLLFSFSPVFAAEKLPNDVRQFIAQRDACDHFRGELPDPEEAERMREVTGQIEKRCRGTDRRLHSLKKKYDSDANVKKRLNVYDEQIEPRANQRSVAR
jgi:hypothetical protein